LGYAFATQRNFRIHVLIGSVVFALAGWLQFDLIRLAVLVLTVTAVLVLELLNTAMEAVVDLSIGRRYHPLARIARLCSRRCSDGRNQFNADCHIPDLASLNSSFRALTPPFRHHFADVAGH
jgi:hypothetical protein